ncbi:MAG: hypothetical protein LQ340_005648 [Diploschistes diacapsis]|nr:MAG: hypothetical protein LQ340_005648 [Diploschistes diacapsis]
MAEAADNEQGLYDMKNVSVVNTGGKAKFPWGGTPVTILLGLNYLTRHVYIALKINNQSDSGLLGSM